MIQDEIAFESQDISRHSIRNQRVSLPSFSGSSQVESYGYTFFSAVMPIKGITPLFKNNGPMPFFKKKTLFKKSIASSGFMKSSFGLSPSLRFLLFLLLSSWLQTKNPPFAFNSVVCKHHNKLSSHLSRLSISNPK